MTARLDRSHFLSLLMIVAAGLGVGGEAARAAGTWELKLEGSAQGNLTVEGEPIALQLRPTKLIEGKPEAVRVETPVGAVRGEQGIIQFRAKSEWGRTFDLALVSADNKSAGLDVTNIYTDANGRDFRFEFKTTAADPALLRFNVGGDKGAIEFSNIRLTLGGRVNDLNPAAPNPTTQSTLSPPPVEAPMPTPLEPTSAKEDEAPRMQLHLREGGVAQTSTRPDGSLRVNIDQPASQAWGIQLEFPIEPVVSGGNYTLKARLKSDEDRPVIVAGSLNQEPWTSFGLYKSVPITNTFSTIVLPFRATASLAPARIYFDLGQHKAGVEIVEVTLEGGGQVQRLWPMASPAPMNHSPAPTSTPAASLAPPQASAGSVDRSPWTYSSQGTAADVTVVGASPFHTRVKVFETSKNLADTKLSRASVIRPGGTVRFLAKAENQVELPYVLSNAQWRQNGAISLPANSWQRVTISIPSSATNQAGTLELLLGGGAIALEVAEEPTP